MNYKCKKTLFMNNTNELVFKKNKFYSLDTYYNNIHFTLINEGKRSHRIGIDWSQYFVTDLKEILSLL